MDKPNKILKKLLESRQMSQVDFARLVDQSPSRIGDILHERVEGNFSYRTLDQWAKKLGYKLEITWEDTQ